jgi:multidrug resistance protein, MATE family
VMQLNSVAFMPAFAMASAGAIVVGQAIGAGYPDEVPLAVRRTFLLAGGWQATVGLAYVVIPTVFFAPFVQGRSTEGLMEIGVRMLALSAGWQLFDAAATTLAETLRGARDTTWPLLARLVLAWGVFVPGSWITVRWYGGDDVSAMLWLILYLGLLAALLAWRFRSGAWRRIVLVPADVI